MPGSRTSAPEHRYSIGLDTAVTASPGARSDAAQPPSDPTADEQRRATAEVPSSSPSEPRISRPQ